MSQCLLQIEFIKNAVYIKLFQSANYSGFYPAKYILK